MNGDLLNPPTRLSDDPGAVDLVAGQSPEQVATAHPNSLVAWSLLAAAALRDQRILEAYAYARVGYHRGLDALRRSGWKGTGPVPWEHEPNRGFLRSLYVLGESAAVLGESDEAQRCRQFLDDSDPQARGPLETS